jgi:hypothetical protein
MISQASSLALLRDTPVRVINFPLLHRVATAVAEDCYINILNRLFDRLDPATVVEDTYPDASFMEDVDHHAARVVAAYGAVVPSDPEAIETAVREGSGGSSPAGQQVSNVDLTGSWTPTSPGTDQFAIGDITINANVTLFGNVTASCTPSGTQPVAEALTVS